MKYQVIIFTLLLVLVVGCTTMVKPPTDPMPEPPVEPEPVPPPIDPVPEPPVDPEPEPPVEPEPDPPLEPDPPVEPEPDPPIEPRIWDDVTVAQKNVRYARLGNPAEYYVGFTIIQKSAPDVGVRIVLPERMLNRKIWFTVLEEFYNQVKEGDVVSLKDLQNFPLTEIRGM